MHDDARRHDDAKKKRTNNSKIGIFPGRYSSHHHEASYPGRSKWLQTTDAQLTTMAKESA
jgi:hypothetical protein